MYGKTQSIMEKYLKNPPTQKTLTPVAPRSTSICQRKTKNIRDNVLSLLWLY